MRTRKNGEERERERKKNKQSNTKKTRKKNAHAPKPSEWKTSLQKDGLAAPAASAERERKISTWPGATATLRASNSFSSVLAPNCLLAASASSVAASSVA